MNNAVDACAPDAMAPAESQPVDISKISRVLADPKRLEILEMIAQNRGIRCADLISRVTLSQPTVSHHLKELNLAGLIHSERDGASIVHTVNAAAVQAYIASLQTRLTATATDKT